jgi:hypothetical protein
MNTTPCENCGQLTAFRFCSGDCEDAAVLRAQCAELNASKHPAEVK